MLLENKVAIVTAITYFIDGGIMQSSPVSKNKVSRSINRWGIYRLGNME